MRVGLTVYPDNYGFVTLLPILPKNMQLTPQNTLTLLFWLRWGAVALQALVFGVALQVFHIALPVWPLAATIAALALWNLGVRWRLTQPWAVTEPELFGHLLIDVAALTVILFWAGGSTNPFISFYLVPIAVSAVALHRRYLSAMTAICILLYTALLVFYVPIPHTDRHGMGEFQLHVLGMWVNFLFSAIFIAFCTTTLVVGIRQRDELIRRHREEALRNEHIVALGTLATGTAHELGTPLATITLLADELHDSLANQPPLQTDLDLIKQQVMLCKASLSHLLKQTDQAKLEAIEPVSAHTFIKQVANRLRLMRPEIRLALELNDCDQTSATLAEPTLGQALLNLLNNAADASREAGSDHVRLHARCSDNVLNIDILDEGSGLSAEDQARAGHAIFTTKQDGFGLGLVLSEASMSRLGGRVSLHRRQEGGTQTMITLPLSVSHA